MTKFISVFRYISENSLVLLLLPTTQESLRREVTNAGDTPMRFFARWTPSISSTSSNTTDSYNNVIRCFDHLQNAFQPNGVYWTSMMRSSSVRALIFL